MVASLHLAMPDQVTALAVQDTGDEQLIVGFSRVILRQPFQQVHNQILFDILEVATPVTGLADKFPGLAVYPCPLQNLRNS